MLARFSLCTIVTSMCDPFPGGVPPGVALPRTPRSIVCNVTGQQRSQPIQLPAYLHGTGRPNAAPNLKVNGHMMRPNDGRAFGRKLKYICF